MTFLVDPPRPIAVRIDADGQPYYLRGAPLVGDVQVMARWVADVDW